MERRSVVLGYSGGMDSRTAAARLRTEGYRVVAVTIDCTGNHALLATARERAEADNLEWLSYDARKEFRREVIDYFTSSYAQGLTPAPCTRCNTKIKWSILERIANSLSIEYIATGHYFNVAYVEGHHFVERGKDPNKDQSYYLWGLSEQTLRRALTPMGSIFKSDIRQNFEERGESMGICFLEGAHYSDFLASQGVEMRRGKILNSDGDTVGEHNGIARYTIGQRRGNGIPEGMRIIAIDAKTNSLIVGPMEKLYKRELYIEECNIIDPDKLLGSDNITIKIRGIGRNPELPVKITPCGNGYMVATQDPAWAPAKGQPLVLYRNNLVLGGGIVVDFV